MPKVGMEPIRRRQLIEATIESINEMGFGDTTVKQISARAGVSTGIIHHYFGGKEDLLEATMRKLLTDLREENVNRLSQCTDPKERVEAVIDANFSDRLFDIAPVTAWLAFWAQVPHSKRLRRLQQINKSRLHSSLRHALRQLVSEEDARKIAFGIDSIMDGLWVSCAVNGGTPTPAQSRELTRDYFYTQLDAIKRRKERD
ncbi:choline-binding transcriptional repressor BetI [Aestuariispira insulae]|uniref:HTH-type transcriptional regulator BetI n=1 Tax=Aestuariispira insulae TaxID=1461337 RepID=A0A3D9HK18_9PROT|nr:transcriptional regulator BetI [Aestuariispira insulae]RED49847.1 TetR family transcriptional regulator [Aestuariispira insulae]